MPSTLYIDGVSPFVADSANDFDRLHYTILGDPADLPAVKALLHAAPGAIGGTTPAPGSFTTLSASGAADVPSLFSTGDVKLTLKTAADTGWVLMNDGTIGNAASGGTTRANADTVSLFTLLWNNTADAQCAVSTGRGANAAADYAANKTIALPKALGRALATYGSGSGLTARVLAQTLGAETHTLAVSEIPSHNHPGSLLGTKNDSASPGSGGAPMETAALENDTVGLAIASEGGGGAHNNMQPTLFLNVMIKL